MHYNSKNVCDLPLKKWETLTSSKALQLLAYDTLNASVAWIYCCLIDIDVMYEIFACKTEIEKKNNAWIMLFVIPEHLPLRPNNASKWNMHGINYMYGTVLWASLCNILLVFKLKV